MNEYGQLIQRDTKTIFSIPDWYKFERDCVIEEIKSNQYKGIDIAVRVEALPNAHGFVELGTGHLRHDMNGFTLSLNNCMDNFPLTILNKNLESVQTEYNYRQRGKCLVLSTKDCCYYIYSDSPDFIVTRLEFAVESCNIVANASKANI